MIDITYEKSYWHFDKYQMILEGSEGEMGRNDSVGRNAFMYICHPNEGWLKETILQCIKQRDDTYLQFYRYPGIGADTMSRDHVTAIILALYINRDKDELKWVLDNLPWRLSRKYMQTIDMWVWHRALRYESWREEISIVFHFMVIFQLILIIPWNFILRTIGWIWPTRPKNVDEPKPMVKQKWRRVIYRMIYPHYALFNLAWQVKVMPKSILKTITQFLIRVAADNEVIKVIAGKKIDKWIEEYVPVSSFQWAHTIDNIRGMPRKLSEDEIRYNDLTKAMLDYLYFGIDKIMLEYDDDIIRAIKNKEQIIQY